MRVLVTGATGGLGRNAVARLLEQDIAVRATGRNLAIGSELAAAGAEFVPLDLARAPSPELVALAADCDQVWHCAALSAPWGKWADFHRHNVAATRELATAALVAGVRRFIHVSTPALYFDFRTHLDVPEHFVPRRRVNHYAASKAAAESEVLAAGQAGLHVSILRPRAIFGPHDQALLPRLLKRWNPRTGALALPRGGRVTLDLTYVDNVVHALRLAGTREDLASGGVYNITNGDPWRLDQVLTTLFEHLGKPLVIRNAPYPLLAGIARLLEAGSLVTGREPSLTAYSLGAISYGMTLDISRARRELGYNPVVDMPEAIAWTAQWARERQWPG